MNVSRLVPLAPELPVPLIGNATREDVIARLGEAQQALTKVGRLLEGIVRTALGDLQAVSDDAIFDEDFLDQLHNDRVEPVARAGVFADEWQERMWKYVEATEAMASIAPAWMPAAELARSIDAQHSALNGRLAQLVNRAVDVEIERRRASGAFPLS